MKRLTLGIATVVMFGTLFSMATGYAVWQVVQLNALLSLTATEHTPRLAAEQNTPTPTPRMPTDTQPIKQAVYVTVESGGAAVEVSVADKP
jgi:hypothetical protein